MIKAPFHRAAEPNVDAAALHPDLHGQDERGHYQACSALRRELKALLAEGLKIEHDQFLLPNTTQAVITAIAGLASDRIALRVNAGTYPPYASLPSWPSVTTMAETPLLTHVHPLSGTITDASSTGLLPSVMDTAQSFATIRHHCASLQPDIFVCSLHKHAGITVGLGVLGIRKNLKVPGLKAYAEVAEAGACSRLLLQNAVKRTRQLEGRLVNLMSLEIDANTRGALAAKGIDVLTPVGAGLPFVCMSSADPEQVASICSTVGLQTKFFRTQNIVRVSGAIRGAIDSEPIDCSRLLKRALSILLKSSP